MDDELESHARHRLAAVASTSSLAVLIGVAAFADGAHGAAAVFVCTNTYTRNGATAATALHPVDEVCLPDGATVVPTTAQTSHASK